MSTKKLIRIFCIFQFVLVVLYVMLDGVEKSETTIILISAIFGTMLDGFAQNANKVGMFRHEKHKLDMELDQLMDGLKEDNKEN